MTESPAGVNRDLGSSGVNGGGVASTGHVTHEVLRKSLHIAGGLFAVTLRWLSWEVAAAVAAFATVANMAVLHRLAGRRVARHPRGYDFGIVAYPFAVMVLILLFRNRLEIAGTAWAILAFGDGFATLAGRFVRGPRLPWHPEKSWSGLAAFLVFGFVAGQAIFVALQTIPTRLPVAAIVAAAVIAAAVAETLPTRIDDNLTVPFASAFILAVLASAEGWPQVHADAMTLPWLLANGVLAFAGYLAKSVTGSGMAGGFALGAIIILFSGWELYVVLLAFFIVGTGLTRFGYRRKAERGLAQEDAGRRGFSHAFANVGVSSILALCSSGMPAEYAMPMWLAAAAALTTAAADTAGSEIGQLWGRTAFMPLSLRRVPPGTEGAISLQGTAAGVIAAIMVAVTASTVSLGRIDLQIVTVLAVSGVAGSLVESAIGSVNASRGMNIPNGVLNFINTIAGACIAYALVR
ncbi:MAG TPA: DUF92 domain-containing protein [Thermoanaerobaculia bacterium]|nr:DUF92 domain-containing protein [Thermoanaerobaculia bacterium]